MRVCMLRSRSFVCRHASHVFFFNDTATTEIYTLSLHDALPICGDAHVDADARRDQGERARDVVAVADVGQTAAGEGDRKSTRLNSSHANISYAVFCLKKKTQHHDPQVAPQACRRHQERTPALIP